ncbi:tyrosine-type recombinase/integrase [Stenotrophomonas sp. SY1]|uniref:tyrosine-type recombinase/integrase n=1 Tax=Stenotrophomonas sp. SY1 TaxID=477235 RepID=UPI002FC34FD3
MIRRGLSQRDTAAVGDHHLGRASSNDRKHHTQVLPEQLSRAFATARDAASVDMGNPPTFHEIRSLGGALLKEAGWTNEQIQALMGHSNVAMTEHYLGGHEAPWQAVSTGISLPQ